MPDTQTKEIRQDLTSAILQDGVRSLIAFSQTGSFSDAAMRLGKSQPSVSRALAGLEAELGVDLLDRTVRPVRLTPQGASLLKLLEEQQESLALLLSGLREESLIKPDLRIGICESVAWSFSCNLVKELNPRFSEIETHVASSAALLPELDSGALDMLFCSNPFMNRNDLLRLPVFEEPSVLIFPKGRTPLTGNGKITWDTLRTCGLPHIRCSKMTAAGQSELSYFSEHEMEFPGRFVVNENALLLQYTASGLGWALARPTTLTQYPDLAARTDIHPMPEPVLKRTARVVLRKGGREWAAEAVASAIRKHYEEAVLPEIERIAPWAAGKVIFPKKSS